MFGQQSFIAGSQYRNSSSSRGRNQRNVSYWLAPQFAQFAFLLIPDPSVLVWYHPWWLGPSISIIIQEHAPQICLWANLMISEVTATGQYGTVRTCRWEGIEPLRISSTRGGEIAHFIKEDMRLNPKNASEAECAHAWNPSISIMRQEIETREYQ